MSEFTGKMTDAEADLANLAAMLENMRGFEAVLGLGEFSIKNYLEAKGENDEV